MSDRSAASHAAFFLPHLKKGMSSLDCGCGPGTITIDIARAVSPGDVIGIDLAETEVSKAKANARAAGVRNVQFRAASVYDLPFADGQFDAVFSNALFEHLSDPVRAAREIMRVLRPGGVAGIRALAISRNVWWPYEAPVADLARLWAQVGEHNGGDFDRALRLPAIVQEAGFEVTQASPSFSPDTRVVTAVIERLRDPALAAVVIENGWMSATRLRKLLDAAMEWSSQSGAVLWSAWGEVVARKPE